MANSKTSAFRKRKPQPGQAVQSFESSEFLAETRNSQPEITRGRRIAEAAYYRAERRGFEPGHELEDWLAAEAEIVNHGLEPTATRDEEAIRADDDSPSANTTH
jgi:hypothetical protein